MRSNIINIWPLALAQTVVSTTVRPAPGVYSLSPITSAPTPRASLGPELEKRATTSTTSNLETRDDFIGYISSGSSSSAQFCNGGFTWTSSSDFATCCSRGQSCAQITACTSTSLMIDNQGTTWTCDDGAKCALTTVFGQVPNVSPESLIACFSGPTVLYRDLASSTSSTDSSNSSSQSSSAAAQSSSTAAQSSGSSDAQTSDTPKSTSHAGLIAGVIVACVVVLAIIGGMVVYFKRRAKRDRIEIRDDYHGGSHTLDSKEAHVDEDPSEQRYEMGNVEVQLPGSESASSGAAWQKHELSANHNVRYELADTDKIR